MARDSGMFLLAKLHLDSLNRKADWKDIENAIRTLPNNLAGAFQPSLRRIQQKPLAKHLLTWVVHAKAPLTINQIEESFALQQGKGKSRQSCCTKQDILSCCDGLVVVSDEGKLCLVHDSLKEQPDMRKVVDKDADLNMAKVCLASLLEQDDSPPSLLPYAATHWSSHLGRDCHLADSDALKSVEAFLGDSGNLARAFNAMRDTDGFQFGADKSVMRAGDSDFEEMTGLHAAVYFDLQSWVDRLLRGRVDVNAQCADGQTAVHWAVRLSRVQLLTSLIQHSADIDICDVNGDTPLHKALVGQVVDSVSVVRILVAHKAKLNIRGANNMSPLSWAIRYGPTAIAEILIESQADVNAGDCEGWTSLRQLFNYGHNIIESLPTLSDEEESEQLKRAVESHTNHLFSVILDRGVDLNLREGDGWLPLPYAASNGDLTMLHGMLRRHPNPADPNLRDQNGKSPLRLALEYNRDSAARLLIAHGANFNENNADGTTPLIQAVEKNDEEMVWFLLKMGAEPNPPVDKERSPLLSAIRQRNKHIVWLLIINKADVRRFSNDALFSSIQKSDSSMTWLLCEHGANPNAVDDRGWTPLYLACNLERKEIVNLLLSHGANIGHACKENSTALHQAVLRKNHGIVSLLAPRAKEQQCLEQADGKGNTALILATRLRSKAVIQTLLQNSASCDTQNLEGFTALHYAAMREFNDLLPLLIEQAENLDLADRRGCTAIHLCVDSKDSNDETIRMLATNGANLDVVDDRGFTPLMLATYLCKESVVAQLLDKGADVCLQGRKGRTAHEYVKAEDRYVGIKRLLDEALLRARARATRRA